MKRFPLIGAVLLIPALALVFLTGCPAAKDGKTTPAATTAPPTGGTTDLVKIKAPTDGVIKGMVKISGDPPEIKKQDAINGLKDPKDKAFCLQGGGINTQEQLWILDKNGGVANVVIWLEPAKGKMFDVTDELKKPFKTPVTIKQPHCQYIPHIAAVYAGVQPLRVESSPGIAHNVKITPEKVNKPSDDNLPPKSEAVEHKFKLEPTPIKMACSIHTWMQAQVFTFDHPYFAVTKEDGTYEIKGVPSGEEMVLYVWHESMAKKHTANATYKAAKGDNDYSPSITAKGEIK